MRQQLSSSNLVGSFALDARCTFYTYQDVSGLELRQDVRDRFVEIDQSSLDALKERNARDKLGGARDLQNGIISQRLGLCFNGVVAGCFAV